MREVGISQLTWRACEALRMRVSMSAMGSLIVMGLPASFRHARDLAGQGETAEADAAQRKAANEGARSAAQAAATVLLHLEPGRSTGLCDHRFLCQVVASSARFSPSGCLS